MNQLSFKSFMQSHGSVKSFTQIGRFCHKNKSSDKLSEWLLIVVSN